MGVMILKTPSMMGSTPLISTLVSMLMPKDTATHTSTPTRSESHAWRLTTPMMQLSTMMSNPTKNPARNNWARFLKLCVRSTVSMPDRELKIQNWTCFSGMYCSGSIKKPPSMQMLMVANIPSSGPRSTVTISGAIM